MLWLTATPIAPSLACLYMEGKRPDSVNSTADASVAPGDRTRRPTRLLEAVRDKLRANHYSLRTETAYIGWVRRFIRANRMRHPREMGGARRRGGRGLGTNGFAGRRGGPARVAERQRGGQRQAGTNQGYGALRYRGRQSSAGLNAGAAGCGRRGNWRGRRRRRGVARPAPGPRPGP